MSVDDLLSYTVSTTCPVTKSLDKVTYLDLGLMPLANQLCDSKAQSLNSEKYPLEINFYPQSKLSMLGHIVNPKKLFSKYCYQSGINPPYVDHCRNMYRYLEKFVDVKDDRIIDIGGNDGTLLRAFLKNNDRIKTLNVDPASNLRNYCEDSGIEVINDYWNRELAQGLEKSKVVVSTNVLQHLPDIEDFARGVESVLQDDGIWCLEFPYWLESLKQEQFDHVYHEHIYYYLVTFLEKLLTMCGLKIINVSLHSIHCGTMRLIIAKKGFTLETDETLNEYMEEESKLDTLYHIDWGLRVLSYIQQCRLWINDLQAKNMKIAGFGASARGCVFLNSVGVNDTFLDYIIDDTPLKQGKFMPGVGTPIVSRQRLTGDPPDYILILAHNFADYIIRSLKEIYAGKFIIMFPTIRVIE